MQDLKFSAEVKSAPPKALLDYVKSLKTVPADDPRSFIQASSDEKMMAVIFEAANRYRGFNPKNVVLIGIGGSNLGALAIYSALKQKGAGEILFVDTIDSRNLERILGKIDKTSLIVIVSKSGTTAETIANAAAILDRFPGNKAVAITDAGSKLWRWAEKRGLEHLEIPKAVGGRFSTFTAVGLFPLAVAGIDIKKLIIGVKKATDVCLLEDSSQNPALVSALAIYENYKKGQTIYDLFIFEPDLEMIGKYCRQLIGESLGKDGKGITPTVSIGTADLHSVGQLYLGGPKDKFTTFLSVKNHGADFVIPNKTSIAELVPDLAEKKFSEALAATLNGVKAAYRKKDLPFSAIELAEISEGTIGAFLAMKMLETVYLGKLLNVNAFDQPAVESYKEETRKLLSK
ncbi:MAG: SIS domain-containing protein [Candidatus Harrisonbacteria bacterium]|nr:SIS domain-containing protein [Candidatus Harrisonbacteria bacterium]